MRPLCTATLLLLPVQVDAHSGPAAFAAEPQALWHFEPWTTAALALIAAIYLRGLHRLWRRSGIGHGVSAGAAAAFCTGWIVLALALLSPLDGLGEQLFWMHMLQHEILMLVAAPLLVLGRPLATAIWAFQPWLRRRLGAIQTSPPLRAASQWLLRPLVAWAVQAAVLWSWHAPPVFELALARPWVHALQHFSFLCSAMLFWWACWASQQKQGAQGALVVYQFTTMVHTGALGALLVFSPREWFPAYAETAPLWGWSALEDQQLGGLIMWIPAGAVYLAAGLALLRRWVLSGSPVRGATPV